MKFKKKVTLFMSAEEIAKTLADQKTSYIALFLNVLADKIYQRTATPNLLAHNVSLELNSFGAWLVRTISKELTPKGEENNE